MNKYIFSFGKDVFSKDSREYVTLDTDKGKLLAIALETSGVPHTGTFTDKQVRFSYDSDYKDTVDEIVKKASSDEYEEMLREIKERKDDSGYLVLLPSVAHYLNMTEGTLRNRPNELQVHLCKMFTRLWYCDTPTIQRELTRALNANRQTERDIDKAKEQENVMNVPMQSQSGMLSKDILIHQAEIIRSRQEEKQKIERERKRSNAEAR